MPFLSLACLPGEQIPTPRLLTRLRGGLSTPGRTEQFNKSVTMSSLFKQGCFQSVQRKMLLILRVVQTTPVRQDGPCILGPSSLSAKGSLQFKDTADQGVSSIPPSFASILLDKIPEAGQGNSLADDTWGLYGVLIVHRGTLFSLRCYSDPGK